MMGYEISVFEKRPVVEYRGHRLGFFEAAYFRKADLDIAFIAIPPDLGDAVEGMTTFGGIEYRYTSGSYYALPCRFSEVRLGSFKRQ